MTVWVIDEKPSTCAFDGNVAPDDEPDGGLSYVVTSILLGPSHTIAWNVQLKVDDDDPQPGAFGPNAATVVSTNVDVDPPCHVATILMPRVDGDTKSGPRP